MAKKITIPNVTLSIVLPEHKDKPPGEVTYIYEELLPKLENLPKILDTIVTGASDYLDEQLMLPYPYFSIILEVPNHDDVTIEEHIFEEK